MKDDELNVFSPDVILYEIIFLTWQSIIYIVVVIVIDQLITRQEISNLLCNKASQRSDESLGEDVDEEVQEESDRILSGETYDVVVLKALKKQYSDGKIAVDGLSFGIPSGQCFGLIGMNGAGKTSTMAMLTAEFPPTSGSATIDGCSVTKEPERIIRHIGYCPQFDAHFMNMTGR